MFQKLLSSEFKMLYHDYENMVLAKGYRTGQGTMYQKAIHDFLIWCETHFIVHAKEITTDIILAYYENLQIRPGERGQAALAQMTINHHLFALRILVDFLWNTKRIDHLIGVPPNLKIAESHAVVLSTHEVEILFKSAKTKEQLALLVLTYGCGLRSAEICQLKVKDIIFENGFLVVEHGKGNKTREIPMSNLVQICLRNYVNEFRKSTKHPMHKRELVFIDKNQARVTNLYLNRLLKKIIKEVYLNEHVKLKFTLHDLRHSIATHLSENGAGIVFVRDFLGHHSIDTSSLYMVRRQRQSKMIA